MLRHIIACIIHPYQEIENTKDRKRASQLATTTSLVYEIGRQFGYDDDSETTKVILKHELWRIDCLNNKDIVTREELSSRFDPYNEARVERIENYPPEIMVRASHSGIELFNKVVEANFGDTLIETTVKVIVGHHTTKFYDKDGKASVEFLGAGRKMDGVSTWRAWNAVQAMKLVGIITDDNSIPQQDMRPGGYEPLVFEKVNGEWISYELARVPG